MAASVQSQPPKPPPPPPKVEAAPKAAPQPAAEAKPAAQASAAPASRPAAAPDLFEQKSGGGRALPTNGGSSFSPAVGAAQNQLRGAVSGVQSDLQSALGSVNDAARQNGATGFQLGQDPAGFGGFSDQPLGGFDGGLGDYGGVTGSGPGRFDPPSVFLSTGGAAGGVGDRSQTLNLSDTFSRNFGNPNGYGYGGFLGSDAGGGSKPGIGGGLDYLNLSGGGGIPSFAATTPQPAASTQTTSNDFGRSNPFGFDFNFGFENNGHHLGLFNFGSARGGGGGAAGGVADRSGW